MMEEALEAILPLLAGEIVDMRDRLVHAARRAAAAAAVHAPALRGRRRRAGVAVRPPLAGKHGLVAALDRRDARPSGFNALATAWTIMEDRAAEYGTTVDRDDWRLVGPMHIAETREQAKEDVKFGLAKWLDYFSERRRAAARPAGRRPSSKVVDAAHRERLRRHRHAGRRDRADRAAGEAVGRLRRASCSWRTTGPIAKRR